MPRLVLFAAVLLLIALAVRSVARHVAALLGPGPGSAPEPHPEETGPGELLHRVVMDAYGLEREGWATQRARRVEARLQTGCRAGDRLRVEILWIPECSAFTAPGRWIYVSRRLLERCPDDDALALVVAHEIAHHRLGHLDGDPVGRLLARLAFSPEQERDADLAAFRMCLDAGFDPRRCLHAFTLMEDDSLDRGDRAGVFGSEREIAAILDGEPQWRVELERWLHTRRRGYAPLRERMEVVRDAYPQAFAA